MERNSVLYQQYTEILREELVPAMGCTEPISIAYAAAKCRALLGCEPERCVLEVSSSIIKNVKSVIVPNTGGRKGIETAVAAGIVGGDETAQLQVLAHMQPAQIDRIEDYLKATPILVKHAQNGIMFYIDITVWGKGHTARLAISHHHTNIIRIEKDGCVLLDKTEDASAQSVSADRSVLSVEGIWDYVNSVALEDVSDAISRQIDYNSALAKEGLTNRWGAQIGRITQQQSNGDVRMLAQLYRALVLSDLVTIHQKTGIGSVSAFCGAVCAGVGAGCGIAYLQGADYDVICHAIVNALAILSGMLCDGAKSSCAAKISAAVDAGIMGYTMYASGQQFYGGDGIVKKGVERSISSVCTVARDGMRETNDLILEVMLQK